MAQTSTPPAGAPATDQAAKIRELEDRIIALENLVRELKAAQAPAAPSQAQAGARAEAAAAEPVPAPPPVQTGGASSMAKALNPDIGVVGQFIGSAGHNPIRPVPSLEFHEAEAALQAIIDPYARGDFFLSFGEEGVELEEGYITFTALPKSLVARAGKMRSAFGKVNTFHNHVLPWVDRPLVTENLAGGEDGISDAGFSVTRILPAPKGLFLEGTGQVYRGDASNVFTTGGNRNNLGVVGHLRGYSDLTENTNLDLGFSYARGHNDNGAAYVTNLYGADATLRWKPLRRSIYHSFVGRSELVWSHRDGLPALLGGPGTQKAFGFYTAGDYQLARRWFAGARFDRSGRARDASQTDRGGSLVLTFWPSEFSQVRAQYRFTRYAERFDAHELRFQLQFSLGAHGAHPF